MKQVLLILIACVCITLNGCKKVYNYNDKEKEEIATAAMSTDFIASHDWELRDVTAADNGKYRYWKLKIVGGERILEIEPVDDSIFWKPEYARGKTLSGKDVIFLLDWAKKNKK